MVSLDLTLTPQTSNSAYLLGMMYEIPSDTSVVDKIELNSIGERRYSRPMRTLNT